MAKQGEIDYLRNLGDAGKRHALDKPFSDLQCAKYLIDMGVIMNSLPPPPAKLLDVGCGTGWTSVFFARRGYDVTGQDIAPDMIDLANENKTRNGLTNLQFYVSDYEEMPFRDEFDAAVFYDALHHSVDEKAAIRAVHRALKPGGILVTLEPGEGHSTSANAIEAMNKYGVTERDMPPSLIIAAAKEAGFRHHTIMVAPVILFSLVYGRRDYPRLTKLLRWRIIRSLALAALFFYKPHKIASLVILQK